MPDVLPTFPQEPAQGIQAQLDLVYLFNPDVANGVIDKCNELLEEIGELSNLSGKIKPYAELVAPIAQYMPTTYGDGLYVANEIIDILPVEFDPTQWTLIATKINPADITQEINTAVGNEATARSGADDLLQGQITAHVQNESNPHNVTKAQVGLGNVDNTSDANKPISTATQGALNNLQTQIDAISAASDVKDIVGTYAELEQYDTSTLGNNDIIKVLQDETQEDATTYYRWSASSEEFTLIGEEGPYYTKSQTDTLLSGKQNTLTAGEGITIENNVISATTTGDFVPQYTTMPVATAADLGVIGQYIGTTTPSYTNGYFYTVSPIYGPASATIAQTVGDSLIGLTVDVDTFVAEEQPAGSGDTVFTLVVTPATLTPTTFTVEGETLTINPNVFIPMLLGTYPTEMASTNRIVVTSKNLPLRIQLYDGQTALLDNDIYVPADWGISFTGDYSALTLWTECPMDYTAEMAGWQKSGSYVAVADYGISYSGLPASGDELTVSYVAPGITGYAWTEKLVQPRTTITMITED